jgi:asparagine synthase (glutamine-hydrolysing)
MCGFLGFVSNKKEYTPYDLEGATQALFNRGPDESGSFQNNDGDFKIYFYHRRLSIIDLDSRSKQPYESDKLILLFNGEIYNYIELRSELTALGYVFNTESDTEVVLKSYEEWGDECFHKFDGMYSIAIYIKLNKTILLARDFFGEKPLYFHFENGLFVFGSTLDSVSRILNHNKLDLDEQWISLYLKLGFAPAPLTPYAKIKKILPGQILKISLVDGSSKSTSTSLSKSANIDHSNKVFDINEFLEIFKISLRRRLRSDVPVGLLLSGGIDSSFIACQLDASNTSICALTIADNFDDDAEVNNAIVTSKFLGLDHKVFGLSESTLLDEINASISSMDEPIGDPAYPVLLNLIAQTPKEYKVLICGDGSDELFLSYLDYKNLLTQNYVVFGHFAYAVFCVFRFLLKYSRLNILRRIGLRMLAYSTANNESKFINYFKLNGLNPHEIELLFRNNAVSFVKRLQDYSLSFQLPEYLLLKSDRASMFNSRELRSPFLSKDLYSYISTCSEASVKYGVKIWLKKYLNEKLPNLEFRKKGMFASGQDKIEIPEVKNLRILKILEKFEIPRYIQSTQLYKYRMYILNKWIEKQC